MLNQLAIFDDVSITKQHQLLPYQLVSVRLYDTGLSQDANGTASYRDPDEWLSERMLSRCIGLPVTEGDLSHTCGTVFAAHREGDEAHGVVRLYDQQLIDLVLSDKYVFDTELRYVPGSDVETVTAEGKQLTIEPLPVYLSFLKLSILKG
jgi:hypothetical protein